MLKLKSIGSSRPLGSLVFGWRSSSKKACAQASSGERREAGVYSSSREQSAMASGGVRGLNTWGNTRAFLQKFRHQATCFDTGKTLVKHTGKLHMPVCLTSVMQCRVSSILEVNPTLTQNDRQSFLCRSSASTKATAGSFWSRASCFVVNLQGILLLAACWVYTFCISQLIKH